MTSDTNVSKEAVVEDSDGSEKEAKKVVKSDAEAPEERLEEKGDKPEEEIHLEPELLVDPGKRRRVEVDVVYVKATGTIIDIRPHREEVHYSEELQQSAIKTVWSEWTLPSWDVLESYKEEASAYIREAAGMVMSVRVLRQLYIMRHLRSWSVTKDGEPVKLELKNERLTDEAYDIAVQLNPPLMNLFLQLFEVEILLQRR